MTEEYYVDDKIDITKLKYVLYVRKSTDDPERQTRSLPDQIKECRRYAKRKKIKIIAILQESQSAKKPKIRPIFEQMLKDINRGKYDGIIAWNPDRLARNMKDGGEIINLIDEEIIKDLQFVTHHYSPDANGKMLLGMAFVLSKQYSDKLSQDVTRGLQGKAKEGRSHIPKHGYKTSKGGQYSPDNKNFKLICQAWQLRLRKQSLQSISNYLNDKQYIRHYKTSNRKSKITPQILEKVFKDPFYYGILIQGKMKTNLIGIGKYQQVCTEDEYNLVQTLTRGKSIALNSKKNFYPFQQLVLCHDCNQYLMSGPSTSGSKNKRYLYLRCDTKGCLRKGKSIRSHILLDFVYNLVSNGLYLTKKHYKRYKSEMGKTAEKQDSELTIQLHSKQGKLKQIKKESRTIALGLAKNPNAHKIVKKEAETQIDKLEDQATTLVEEIATIQQAIANLDDQIISLDEFLNLSENADKYIKYGDAFIKDKICKIIFLNLTADKKNITSYQLNEPFGILRKQPSILNGREAKITSRTNYIRNLVDTIIQYWEYSKPLNKTLATSYNPDYISTPVGYIY